MVPVVQAEPSKKPNIFSPLRIWADLNNFWWTREPTWRTFGKMETFFFFAEKNSEFTKRNFGCEFGNFFLQKKKKVSIFPKVRRVGSQVHQKLFKSARILSGEKILKLGTPIEIAT